MTDRTDPMAKYVEGLPSELTDILRNWSDCIADNERLAAERDALRSALTEAIDAFDECTGDYAKELAADDLARWRALVGPAVPAPMQAQAPPWSEFHDPDAERETT